jgi:hypothetical protein
MKTHDYSPTINFGSVTDPRFHAKSHDQRVGCAACGAGWAA